MTEDLREFIGRVINSPLKLELVVYFHRNRYTMDYAEGTAQRVGADPQRVKTALTDLAAAGVVHQRQSAFNTTRPPVFSYTRDDAVRYLVDELSRQLQSEEGRRDVLAMISPSPLEEVPNRREV
jgi:hypothetical protein